MWFEDPLNEEDIYSYVKLRQKLDIPILATEYPAGDIGTYAVWLTERATDYLRGDIPQKGGLTTMLKTAHLAEAFHMNYEVHHGGNSLNNMAQLHFACAITNTTYFEVLLPHGAHKYGLQERHRDRQGRPGTLPAHGGDRRRDRFRADRAQTDGPAELKRNRPRWECGVFQPARSKVGTTGPHPRRRRAASAASPKLSAAFPNVLGEGGNGGGGRLKVFPTGVAGRASRTQIVVAVGGPMQANGGRQRVALDLAPVSKRVAFALNNQGWTVRSAR